MNQQRILKEHIVALEEKGRHDDELIEGPVHPYLFITEIFL